MPESTPWWWQQVAGAAQMAADMERPPRPDAVGAAGDISRRVYDVCTDLGKGDVSPGDRATLRKTLDKAEAPISGVDRANQAIGNLTGNKAKPPA